MSDNQSQGNDPKQTDGISCGCCSGGGRKYLWPLVVLIAALGVYWFRSARSMPEGPGVAWVTDYTAGMAQAKAENKAALLAFSASWCPPCKQMKKTTYHDPAVIALTETLVPIYVDVDKDGGVSDQYGVDGIPTYVVLKPDGTEGGRMAGYHDADEFTAKIKAAMQ